jgi:serine/threonine-protein kinase
VSLAARPAVAESASRPSLKSGDVFDGRYRIVRCIDRGGMGAVYEASHIHTARRCALKLVLPSLAEDAVVCARFRLEATLPAAIDSDHVVDVLDAGIDPKTKAPYLVMELLEGKDLATMLSERGRFSPEDTVLLLWQVSLALSRMHAAGIVHRDIKLQNLFVTRDDEGAFRVKLLDFGIAKLVAADAGPMTATVGTPLYMSPEQIRGAGDIGPRADLYSLGHIAFALLTGRPYWSGVCEGRSVYYLLLEILFGTHVAASVQAARHGALLPPEFDAWFAKATAGSARDRFQDATAMIASLASALRVGLPRRARERWNARARDTVTEIRLDEEATRPAVRAPSRESAPLLLTPPAPRAEPPPTEELPIMLVPTRPLARSEAPRPLADPRLYRAKMTLAALVVAAITTALLLVLALATIGNEQKLSAMPMPRVTAQ